MKNHADSDKLDEQFAKLHKELFANYDCSKCRNCCKLFSGDFNETEIEPAAKLFEISKEEFIDKYLEMGVDGYDAKGTPCCFLTKNGICKIENCKPEGCRDYPFTNRPERLSSLYSIIDSASVCPIVFEMLERLKREYNFKMRKRY